MSLAKDFAILDVCCTAFAPSGNVIGIHFDECQHVFSEKDGRTNSIILDSLKTLLRDELGVEPAPETQHLANQIADGTIALSGSAAPLSVIASAKPVVAVLPFSNMSGDPEQDYFADGIVEDIITALSHFKSLFVIARNSSFTYKKNTELNARSKHG